MTIAEYQRRVQRCVEGVEPKTHEIIAELTPRMIEMQQQQMYSGQRSDGSMIEPQYSYLTRILKERAGEPTDRVTLFDTGDFYGGIFVEDTGTEVVFSSSDWKTEELEWKYGNDIFDLQPERYAELKKAWLEFICKFVQETINQ